MKDSIISIENQISKGATTFDMTEKMVWHCFSTCNRRVLFKESFNRELNYSTNISKMKNNVLPQITEHKKTVTICLYYVFQVQPYYARPSWS